MTQTNKIDIANRYLEEEEVRTNSKPYEAYCRMLSSVFDMSKIKSFCDVGCATGLLQQALKKQNPNMHIHGFEFFDYHQRAANPEIAQTIEIVDLRDPLSHDRKYDLVNCSEVGEHIEPEYASALLANLKSLVGRFLVMTWSPYGGDEKIDPHHQHLNPLQREEFVRRMEDAGFELLPEVTERLLSASMTADFHDWWRQSLTVWRIRK